MLGWDHYSLKNLDTSSSYFFKVSEQSNFYLKSRCFGYYNRLYQGDKSEAKEGFASLQVPALQEDSLGPVMKQLMALELAGIALLERNDQDFDIHSSQFNYEYYPVATEQKNLLKYQSLSGNPSLSLPRWLP